MGLSRTSHLISSHLTSHLTSHLISSLISSHISSHLISSLISSHISSHLISSHLISHLISSHISSHLTSYIISSHLIQSRLASTSSHVIESILKSRVFVGERHTGSALHIDQCLWSNVGRHWSGYKLFFVWRREDVSRIEKHLRKIFIPPLSEEERSALSIAAQVMVMKPGDVCLFSGANPHMAISISNELSCTSYESIINFNLRHLEIFLETNEVSKHHPEDCHIDEETLDDICYDIVDQMNDALDWLDAGDSPHDRCTQAALKAVTYLRSADTWFRRKIRAPHRAKHQKLLGEARGFTDAEVQEFTLQYTNLSEQLLFKPGDDQQAKIATQTLLHMDCNVMSDQQVTNLLRASQHP
eukprot:g2085.t1